jgi:hypothetical protein
MRSHYWREMKFLAENSEHQWQNLIDINDMTLMVVVVLDGRGERINDLKLRLVKDVMAFFQRDTVSKAMNTT